jgi:hypothetical protein
MVMLIVVFSLRLGNADEPFESRRISASGTGISEGEIKTKKPAGGRL